MKADSETYISWVVELNTNAIVLYVLYDDFQLPCWHLQAFVTYIIRHIETIVGIQLLFAEYLNQY
jgi:hypothetical protein